MPSKLSCGSFCVSPERRIYRVLRAKLTHIPHDSLHRLATLSVPYSAYKEHALSKIPTLRSLNNALREDANRLSNEVDTLSEEIDLLEPEADR